MVKIIKKGDTSSRLLYKASCIICDTEFVFSASDINVLMISNFIFHTITCPYCRNTINCSSARVQKITINEYDSLINSYSIE